MNDTELSIRHEEALRYWKELIAKRGRLPGRRQIDPAAMKSFLAWMTLVDVVEDAGRCRYRARLVGTKIAARHGRDITGKFDEELYSEDYLRQVREIYDRLRKDRKPLLVTCRAPVPDRIATSYQRLLLPLSSDGRSVDMILAVFDYPSVKEFGFDAPPPGHSNWEAVELTA